MVTRAALGLALALATAPDAKGLPRGPTPAAALSTPAFRHHEVMRIDRDFGKPQWEIAFDGWISRDEGEIEDVRLWWVNTRDEDRRKPFSAPLRRIITFAYERGSDGTLAVRLAGDGKEYRFTVERDGSGTPVVFADVELADGSIVSHCRCEKGRLIARRVAGIPVGIGSLNVRCTDADDRIHDAEVPPRNPDTA